MEVIENYDSGILDVFMSWKSKEVLKKQLEKERNDLEWTRVQNND